MNRLITLLLFGFLFLTFFAAKANAQISQKITLVEYENTADLNRLFPLSQRVLAYLNGEDFETGIVLAIMTEENIKAVEGQNYSVEILDDNSNIDRYVLLYHPLKNKSDLLKDFGDAKQITPNHTLLKLAENKEFTHEGVGAQFFENPFLEGITPPPNATPVLPQTVNDGKPATESERNAVILVISIVITLLFGAGIGAFLYLKKRKESNSSF